MARTRSWPLFATAVLAAAGALLSLTSCSKVRAYYQVAAGNYAYAQGDLQQANVDYLEAEKSGVHLDYIAYNLGNVYHSLGEGEAAGKEWEIARATKDGTLRAPTLFNLGVLAYELGHYQDAYNDFKEVLELEPADMDAKINLELAYQRLVNERPGSSERPGENVAIGKGSSAADRMLQIVRDKENQQWKAAEGSKVAPGTQDW